MAVKGIGTFKKYFSGFSENYIIIGGTACSIILRDATMRPRATKVTEDTLPVADAIALMCLKMKAYLNLSEQEPSVHSSDIRKRMSDVFKLMVSGNLLLYQKT